MPRYDYRCGEGHVTTVFRSYEYRERPTPCERCGRSAVYQFPLTHRQPDGIYSYAPNIGNPNDHERRNEAIRAGIKVIDRSAEC